MERDYRAVVPHVFSCAQATLAAAAPFSVHTREKTMGQNNDRREQGDKQGQQGGQMDKRQKSNPQESQQQQQQRPGQQEDNNAGGKNMDKQANQGSQGQRSQNR
jgi:hypothetical protein